MNLRRNFCREKFVSVLLAVPCLGLPACSRAESTAASLEETSGRPGDIPAADFSVTKDTKGALFTWVDHDGSFQLTDVASEVPQYARGRVRVVAEGHSPGSAEYIYVVDLSEVDNGANISPRALLRSDWEGTGKAERDKKVAELTPKEEPKGPSPADLGVDAIVYGADWCKPCHLAEDYLRRKGAKVVKKDIEEDPKAASEMRQKLTTAGMSGSSIPIIDVGGTILRGFSEQAIDSALRRVNK